MAKRTSMGLADRAEYRKRRHGNWRQIAVDCAFMCIAWVNGEEQPCGSQDSLEYHEVWGEEKDGYRAKFSQRVLLCNRHHSLVPGHRSSLIQHQYKPSRLFEDLELEIAKWGGLQGWCDMYGLDSSRFGILVYQGLIKVEEGD